MDWKRLAVVFAIGLFLGIFIARPLKTNASLVLDSQYEPVALNLIDSAHTSILVAMYEAKEYNATMPILDALCNASKRGVAVRVLLDDEIQDNNATIAYLRACGVNASLDSRRVRTHAKFMIVDGRYVLLGSTNWSFSALHKNHEVDILVDDPKIAEELTSYFYNVSRE